MSDQQRVITLFCPACNMQVEARVLACEETDFTPKPVPLGEDLVIPLQEVVGAEGSHLHSWCLATSRQDVKSPPLGVPEQY